MRITTPQSKVLIFLVLFRCRTGMMPTVRQTCSAFGWSSTNAACDVLRVLERAGFVRRPNGASRALLITDKGYVKAGARFCSECSQPIYEPSVADQVRDAAWMRRALGGTD